MQYFNLSLHPEYHSLGAKPIFAESFQWIQSHGLVAGEGIYELGLPGWYVNVHGYTTQPRDSCTWENHRQTIDIQFLIEGKEAIDVCPATNLDDPVQFDATKDTEKFESFVVEFSTILLGPGDACIFHPGEAHRPKIMVGTSVELRKLVVKVPVALLERTL